MAKNLVAVFLMCMVVLAAVHVQKAEADEYAACYDKCFQPCFDEGKGYTNCEMKCDTECYVNDIKASVEKIPIKH